MLEKYDKNCKLMYMDTDSFIYDIKCDDLYGNISKDMEKGIDLFVTSNYPSNNRFGIPLVNDKDVEKIKDECCGRLATEIVATRSKTKIYWCIFQKFALHSTIDDY